MRENENIFCWGDFRPIDFHRMCIRSVNFLTMQTGAAFLTFSHKNPHLKRHFGKKFNLDGTIKFSNRGEVVILWVQC
jgi:hypothetical protein